MEKPTHLKFVQIAATGSAASLTLFALDEAGNVWKYIPSHEAKARAEAKGETKGAHFSFWSKLTSYRKQPGSGRG